MRQIIIDNDGGTDDFLTIQYAVLSRQFDIKAITLVAGNTDVENVRNNVFKALEMSGVTPDKAREIGIYAPRHINHDTISDGAQGSNGLGGVDYQIDGEYELNEGNAEDVLIQTVEQNPGNISILAIGPLTNIANAIKQNPKFVQNVDELVIMGGDEGGGNITPHAEFNIYQDPEAAKVVFEAGFKKITMIGFNVSRHFTLSPELEHLFIHDHIEDPFVFNITGATADLDRNKNKVDGASINDALTAMYLLYKDKYFETKNANVEVDISDGETRGKTSIINSSSENSCNVVTAIDKEALLTELFETLYPEKSAKILAALKFGNARNIIKDELIKKCPNDFEIIHKWFDTYTKSACLVLSVASDLIQNASSETVERLLREYFRIAIDNPNLELNELKTKLKIELDEKYPDESASIELLVNSQDQNSEYFLKHMLRDFGLVNDVSKCELKSRKSSFEH